MELAIKDTSKDVQVELKTLKDDLALVEQVTSKN